jgi:hypothetical protein
MGRSFQVAIGCTALSGERCQNGIETSRMHGDERNAAAPQRTRRRRRRRHSRKLPYKRRTTRRLPGRGLLNAQPPAPRLGQFLARSALYEAGSAYKFQPYIRSNAHSVDRSLALKIRYSGSDGPRGHCTARSVARIGAMRKLQNGNARCARNIETDRAAQ